MERGERKRLPSKRRGITYTLMIRALGTPQHQKAHVTINVYEDGRVGEVFINTGQGGSELRTSIGVWAIQVSKSLQFGEPVRNVVKTYRGTRMRSGVIDCELVPAIHGKPTGSLWDAVVQLLEAETRNGVHVEFLKTLPANKTSGVQVVSIDCICEGTGWITRDADKDNVPCPDHPPSTEDESVLAE